LGTNGGHNLDVNPQFVNPVVASLAPTTLGDYRLIACSPAIDKGDTVIYKTARNIANFISETDIDGNPRLFGKNIDLGAYELQQMPSSLALTYNIKDTTICKGDTASIVFTFIGVSTWELVYTKDNGVTQDTIKSISANPYQWKISPADTTVYVFTRLTDANCSIVIDDTVSIKVSNPKLNNILANDTLCHSGTTTPIAFTGATSYKWSSSNTINNIPASSTGNFGTYTVVNNTGSSISTVISVIPSLTINSIACESKDTSKFAITVLPKPTINAVLANDTVCHRDSTQQISFTGTLTDFQWKSNNSFGGDIPTNF
jgi:hypothetical protein